MLNTFELLALASSNARSSRIFSGNTFDDVLSIIMRLSTLHHIV